MAQQRKIDTYSQGASPLVKQIITLILDELDALKTNQPLLPEVELAAKFGVSRKTVRTAMKRLEDHGLVRRIKRKGTFPTHGRNAKPLFRNEVGRIGILANHGIFTPHKNSYQLAIFHGICHVALEQDYQVLTAGGNAMNEFDESIFRMADDNTIDGIALISITNQQLLMDLEKWEKPICLIDHYSKAPSIDCVRTDSHKGSQLAIEHLYRFGHTRIAYANTRNPETNPARLAGFQEGLKKWKLKQNNEWIFHATEGDNETEQIAMQYLALDTRNRPTAIVAFSDDMAEGITQTLTSFGIDIPGDLSIIGTSGLDVASPTPVAMTNVCFQWEELGAIAAETLLERISNPRLKGRNILIPPNLSVRSSTARFTS